MYVRNFKAQFTNLNTDNKLSSGELYYIDHRKNCTQSHIKEYLNRWNISNGFGSDITIGLAISGGGYRAMFTGIGVLSAFDESTPGSQSHMGGLLQASTYIAGISGGLWAVMANYLNGHQLVLHTISQQLESFNVPVLQGISDMDVTGLRTKLDSVDTRSKTGAPVLTRQKSISWNATAKATSSLTSSLLRGFFLSNDGSNRKSNDTVDLNKILQFYKELTTEVRTKRLAKFSISFVDYWGRALIRKIVPNFKKHEALTFSSTRVKAPTQPFPIVCSVERDPDTSEDFRSSHIFEFNPYEFGSWDSFLRHFVDLEYLGTKMKNGKPHRNSSNKNTSVCVKGYDNVAFVTGTSSSLFNTLVEYVHKLLMTMDSEPTNVISLIFKIFGISLLPESKRIIHPEYSTVSPNPFFGIEVKGKGRSLSKAQMLYLADGGDDGQNIPFHPLLIPHRKVDVIFAVDSTSDLLNFPNGTSLRRTAKRYHSTKSELSIPLFQFKDVYKRIFPKTPSEKEFVSKNMKSKPIFLGCEISRDYPNVPKSEFISTTSIRQFETLPNYLPPLIIYTANHDYSFLSNMSTFKATYNQLEVVGMVNNGYNVATGGNSTEYLSCVACAIVKRSSDRLNYSLPAYCLDCFSKYCYH